MDRLNKVDKRVLVGAIITVAVLLSVGISIIIWFWNPWQQSTISLKQRGPYLTVEAKLEGSG